MNVLGMRGFVLGLQRMGIWIYCSGREQMNVLGMIRFVQMPQKMGI